MVTDLEKTMGRVVSEFMAAGNRFDVDAQLLLLADDARIQIPGFRLFDGKNDVRRYLEMGVGLRQQTTLVDCRLKGSTMICDCVRRDDWLKAAGIPEFHFTYEFTLRDDLITSMRGSFSPHDAEILGKTLEGFIPWALLHHRELFGRDGDFNYSRDTGRGLVDAMEQWLRADEN